MKFTKLKFGLLLTALLLTLLSFPLSASAQSNSNAAEAISEAQDELIQGYEVARIAESAGANISQLTSKLNSAGLLLSQAKLAYSSGDYGSALSLAAETQNKLDISFFLLETNSLKSLAEQNRMSDFLLNIVGSVLGTVTVLFGGFSVWVLLKRKYGDKGAS